MIVLLLNCLNNSLIAQENNVSSTGEILKSDTTKVIVPISYLRDANAKLVERLYLIKLNNEKDSVILLYKDLVIENENIIRDFQTKVLTLNKVNANCNNQLNKQKNRVNLLYGITGSTFITFIITLLIK